MEIVVLTLGLSQLVVSLALVYLVLTVLDYSKDKDRAHAGQLIQMTDEHRSAQDEVLQKLMVMLDPSKYETYQSQKDSSNIGGEIDYVDEEQMGLPLTPNQPIGSENG